MNELKPCPYCGGEMKTCKIHNEDGVEECSTSFCIDCGSTGPTCDSIDDVVERSNRRYGFDQLNKKAAHGCYDHACPECDLK